MSRVRVLSLALSTLAFSLTGVAAQTVDLMGRVLEKAGNKPVPGATVKVAGSSLTTQTDTAGRFVLKGNVTALKGGGKSWVAAPYFQGGALHVQSPEAGGEAKVEFYGMGGERLASRSYRLEAGWNRIQAVPFQGRDFLGFARVTVGTESWIKRVLNVAGRMQADAEPGFPAAPGNSAAAARLAKVAAGNVEVSMAKLVTKTVPYNAAADLGDIVLEYPPRKLDVGAPPIYGASVLLDGSKGRAALQAELNSKWQDWPRFTPSEIKFKLAKDPEFPNDTNHATVQSCCNKVWGYDDIQAKEVHGDAQLHVEWIAMGQYDETENPDTGSSNKSPGYVNSGVYVQSRYEIQIESQGNSNPNHDMASLVNDYAPTTWAPNRPNGKWQAYDITFRAARYNASGSRTEHARITVWWNGTVVHDNREAKAPATGLGGHSGEDMNATLYGLKLQSEGRDVRFRNVWIKHLNIATPQTNFGY